MTRASLMNLAVYSEEPDSLNRTRSCWRELPRTTLCRQLVIGANPQAKNIE